MPFTVGKVAEFMTNGRLTGATYYDKDGILRLSPAGGIRLDHDPVTKAPLGVLMESARTNKCICFNANPTTLHGTNLIFSGGSATLTLVDDVAALAAAGLGAICTSGKVYKLTFTAVTYAVAQFTAPGNANQHIASAFVRGSAGAVALSGPVGEEYFPASASYVRRASLAGSPGSHAQVSGTGTGELWIILPQVEEAAVVSSPIITLGAQATRGADALTITGHDTTPWFNPDAWTFFVDFDPIALGEHKSLISTEEAPYIRVRSDGQMVVGLNEFLEAMGHPGTIGPGVSKFAGAYDAGTFASCLNGGAVSTAVHFSGDADLLEDVGDSNTLDGYVRRMGYFPRRLTDSELQAITG